MGLSKYNEEGIKLDANKVVRLINQKFGGVTEYCRKTGSNRWYFYDVLKKRHRNAHIKSIEKIAKNLNVSVEEIVLEEN